MSKIVGVDYGRAKIGLAISEGPLADPWKVLRVVSAEETFQRLKEMIVEEKIEKVVVGISEGEMGEESKNFSVSLGKIVNVPVETFDETLTTQDAQKMAIEAGVSRKKRKDFEDAFAAAVMLQSYLDTHV